MRDLPTHFPMPINADGDGPETDKALVVKTTCWNCIEEEWPCIGSLESTPAIVKTPRLVFFSSTSENTARFIAKLELEALRLPLTTGIDTPLVNEPFVLVTPTYGGDGDRNAIPKQVKKFLNVESNRALLRGVIGAGNTNFGHEYCRAADLIAAKCGVPHIYKFELMGMREDVANVRQGLEEFWS